MAHEAVQALGEEIGFRSGNSLQRRDREAQAEHGGIGDQGSVLWLDCVQPGRDQRVQRLGHGEIRQVAHQLVLDPIRAAADGATVDQHPDGLDRVERNAFRALHDRTSRLIRQPRHQACEQRPHVVVFERLEVDRGRGTHRHTPTRAAVEQVGARLGQHEDR